VADLTIDQLAAKVNMTVRNVRAYAARGLIAAPRLVGRTGYYSPEHVNRLKLVRELLDRGYTLAAVEQAFERNTTLPAGQALDLLDTLSDPRGDDAPEDIEIESLARLANVETDPEFIAQLEGLGLLERMDDTTVRLLKPFIVRAGAQAIALGLERPTVVALLPFLSEQLGIVASRFVNDVRQELWRPFVERGFPEDEWPAMLETIETLLPVASQAVVAIFRDQLNVAIDEALGEELGDMAGEHALRIS
jgi:DNA-binding transcriptional MerR regulator